jgi:uncharacterized protein
LELALPIVLTAFLVLLAIGILVVTLVAWRGAGQLVYPPKRPAEATSRDYALDFDPVSFKSHDGLTLRGWFIPANQPKGTIVLCHGYSGDCSPDFIYAPLLHDAGYNTLFFDFRGHGASDGNYTSLVYFERGDLLAALEFLRSRGIARVGLLGFSMGGAIAIATAPHSEMVVGIISDCAFAELRSIIANAAIGRGFPRWLAPLIGYLTVTIASVRLRANLFSADPIRWVDQIAPRPLFIMHAGSDMDAPVSNAHRLFTAARKPKDLWIVPNTVHRQIEQVARDEYRRRVIGFFDRAFHAD